jgi:hypothetical protein
MMHLVVARVLRDAAVARAATDMVLRTPTPGAADASTPPMAA